MEPDTFSGNQKALLVNVDTHTHTQIHTFTEICFHQFVITNCLAHQALAKWPSLSDLPRYHKHTVIQLKVLIVHISAGICVNM